MKIHLRRAAKDHLTVCGTFAKENWVLVEAVHQQAEGTVCKTCKSMASTEFTVGTQKYGGGLVK